MHNFRRDALGEPNAIEQMKTPTLAIVCKRELKIRNSVPLGYFEVVPVV
jgi:hypothetical protein